VSIHAKRLALLGTAMAILSVSLVACAANVASPINNAPSDFTFSTPDTSQYTATPGFPVFTIGAWPSIYSPNVNDSITIYVICRVQDPTMQTPPTPPNPGVNVNVVLAGPINDSLHGTTDPQGIAAIPYTVNDPYVGQPVDITVSTVYKGQTYWARTFFTSGVSTTPTATKAAGTPTPTP
jgi:hypothetical protein